MGFLKRMRLRGNDARPPSTVRVSRTVMWVQCVGFLFTALTQGWGLLKLRGLSDAQLATLSQQYAQPWSGHSDVPYISMWTSVGIGLLLSIVLGVLAIRLLAADKWARPVIIAVETIVALLALITLPSGSCFVIFGIPGIAVLVLIFKERIWFGAKASPAKGNGQR